MLVETVGRRRGQETRAERWTPGKLVLAEFEGFVFRWIFTTVDSPRWPWETEHARHRSLPSSDSGA
jgi:hypothetical protein